MSVESENGGKMLKTPGRRIAHATHYDVLVGIANPFFVEKNVVTEWARCTFSVNCIAAHVGA